MNLPANQRRIAGVRVGIGTIAIVHPPAGMVKMSTCLTHCSQAAFDAVRATDPDRTGMPIIWTTQADGVAELWPVPDKDYPASVRDKVGRPVDSPGRTYELSPVESWISAVKKAEIERAEKPAPPPRVERFTLVGGTDE